MRTRRHAPWLATGAALLLIASVSGIASAAPLASDTVAPVWVDLNGDGIADSCETGVVADDVGAAAAAAENLAADLDGDGTISTSEAAQTTWVGGTNCNHGGYVSTVAKTSAETCDDGGAPAAATDESGDQSGDGSDQGSDGDATDASTDASTDAPTDGAPTTADTCTEDTSTDDAAPVVCEAAPVVDGTTEVVAPLTHVEVAQSDAVGGKNCNHGGAVSADAKAKNAERAAARALKVHGKSHQHGHHGGQN
jgi:hypothetical protein